MITLAETQQALATRLEIELQRIPFICIHAHLDPKQLVAQGLHHILLYHMPLSELFSSSMLDSNRLSWYANKDEAHSRIKAALPYLKHVKNTSLQWVIKKILGDLYGWHDRTDFNRLAEIHEAVGISLVLHGGSMTPESDIKPSIDLRIRKINVASELVSCVRESLKKQWAEGRNPWLPSALAEAMKGIPSIFTRWMRMAGSEGMA